MNKYLLLVILFISFFVCSSIKNDTKINIYQNGSSQTYTILNDSIVVYFSKGQFVFPHILDNQGMLTNKELINFDGRPTLWFSNNSSSELDSYLTLFVTNQKLKVDCIYVDSFDNYNGFHQKKSECGLDLSPFENQILLERLLYDEKLIEQNKFSFQDIAREIPIKILVGELNELKIYRIYDSSEDYENDNYHIIINSQLGQDFQINHQIYLRYNTKNELIGFDLEKVSDDKKSLQFYSYETLKRLINSGINPQDMQAIVNVEKAYLYSSPSATEVEKNYLVYSDNIILLDQYKDKQGVIWNKVMFSSKKLGPMLAWISDDEIKFIPKNGK